ncbi:MAG TPA: TonB-dependent receptor [Thermoanaerobaculia bacterium]|nr:TonB-dependent receptor [Thermoanaerobaculia bacterium]
MRKSRLFLAALALLLASPWVWAQTTSDLTGTVTSEGKPLPGVLVTVSSPALQGTRKATTGSNGTYSFASLPPGEYTITYELQGLQTATHKTRLLLAQTTRDDAELGVSKVKEEVVVKAQTTAAAVLETNQIAANITSEGLNKLPVNRTIRSAVLLMPGVNPNGVNNQITISGAPSYDNLFLVDGTVVGENLRGQPDNLFIEDAIQEVTTLSGSISAEYGRFTGGVVSTLTKSGSNEFHGSFRSNFSNPNWTEKTPWPTEADHVDKTDKIYEATLGGRFIPDHLWFFGGGRYAKTTDQRFTAFTNIPYDHGFDEKRAEGKLNLSLSQSQSFSASYINISNTELNNIQGQVLDEASLVPDRSLPNTLLAVNYNGLFGNNFVAEAQYSKKTFAFENSGGRYKDRILGTRIISSNLSVAGTAASYNAPTFCGVCTPEERNNDSYSLKGTYFWNSAKLGSHSVVVGGERFGETRIVNNYQSASDFAVTSFTYQVGTNAFPRFDANTTINWTPIFKLSDGTDLVTWSGYINDKWELNKHFSFNVGLRWDKSDAHDADGKPISNDSMWSPRLGVAYDPKGDGIHRFTASYGRYDAKIVDGSNVFSTAQLAGNPGSFVWAYKGPVINPAGTPNDQLISPQDALRKLFDWFDQQGGTSNKSNLTSTSYPGLASRFEGSLKAPLVDEFTVGYGARVGRYGYAKVDYIHRDWDNFYARRLTLATGKVTDPLGNVADQSVTENDSGSIERKYRGIQFQGQWTPNRWNVGGSYTYSTLKGNDDGEGAGTATIRNLELATFYPEYLSYPNRKPIGYLGQDQKHRARLWAGYTLPTPSIGEFSLTALQAYDSGRPYSAIGQIDATGRTSGTAYPGLPANPGYTLSGAGTSHDYYFGSRGEFRTDDVWSTDLAFNYSTPRVFGAVEFFFRATVNNLFNNSAVISPNSDIVTRRSSSTSNLSPFNPFTATPLECPSVNAAGTACTVTGYNWFKGPNFGNATGPTSYQTARTYAFSAGFRF